MLARFVGCLVALVLPGVASALTVTLVDFTPGGSETQHTVLTTTAVDERAPDAGSQSVLFEPSAIPTSRTDVAVKGDARSESGYGFDHQGFEVSVDHVAPIGGGSARSLGAIYFMVDIDVSYVISGEYSLSLPNGGNSKEMALSATLTDLSLGVLLFDNEQTSRTNSQTMRLGEQDGNRTNRLSGSLVGTLVADTPYRWTYSAAISDTASSTPTGIGAGFIDLVLVPEPGTAGLLFGGLLGLALGRRRTRLQ